MFPHRIFYHADIAGSLQEDQALSLNGQGLSAFGQKYAQVIGQNFQLHGGHYRRELMLERVRTHNPNIAGRVPSRFRCVFAALTIQDAKIFAHKSENKSGGAIRIFEIIAPPASYYFRDMGWLDLPESAETASDYVSYWSERLTRNMHDNPFIEVCIDLPARTGKIVAEFTRDENFSWKAPTHIIEPIQLPGG